MGLFTGLFRGPFSLFKRSPGVDVLRLDILMQYSVMQRVGSAALVWSDPFGGREVLDAPVGRDMQVEAVALMYGRILGIHKETRTELFHRIDELAKQNVRTEGEAGFRFEPWVLHVGFGGGDHNLWPWHLTSPSNLHEPKVYSAILKSFQPSRDAPLGRWIYLDMPFGQERILAPASALIAITGFSGACDQRTRYELALMLWQMNAYWRSPKGVSLHTEGMAYAAAREAIKSGKLSVPE